MSDEYGMPHTSMGYGEPNAAQPMVPTYEGLVRECERLRFKLDQYERQLDDRWTGVFTLVNDVIAERVDILAHGDALAAAVERNHGLSHVLYEFDGCCTQVCEAARAWRARRT